VNGGMAGRCPLKVVCGRLRVVWHSREMLGDGFKSLTSLFHLRGSVPGLFHLQQSQLLLLIVMYCLAVIVSANLVLCGR
jgi:hypothetical protein